MTGIAGGHHVLGVEHLLGELGHGQGTVLLASTAGEGSETWHEEMQTGEGHHVDGQFTQISVELSGEAQAGGHTRHGGGDEMVQVTVGGGGELEGTEADVVESLVVNAVCLVSVLNELMDGQGGVVWLHNSVGHLEQKYKWTR